MQGTSTHHHHPDQHIVFITINRVGYDIPAGRHTVSALKDWAEISAADELEQVVDGKLEPLADDATVEIKGEEKFISHPRHGGSS